MSNNCLDKGKRVKDLVSAVRQDVYLPQTSKDFQNCQAKIGDLLAGSLATSTENRYFLSFENFAKFCKNNGIPSLPSEPEVIMTYFVKLSEENKSAASVLMARSAIKHYNLLHKPDNISPTDRADVAMLVKSIERKYSKPVSKRLPTTKLLVKKYIDKLLDSDQLRIYNFKKSIENWQFVAKTVLKFYCFARFEEVQVLKISNFKFLSSGDLQVTFCKGKNNQFHEPFVTIISKGNDLLYCPVNIIRKYLSILKSTSEDCYFLPKIVKDVPIFTECISYSYSSRKLKEVLTLVGEDPSRYGEHSDRIGGLSEAANNGCSLYDLQRQGRWKSEYCPKIYHNRSLSIKRKVSDMLNEL